VILLRPGGGGTAASAMALIVRRSRYACFALTSLLVSRSARSETRPPIDLAWSVPTSCPSKSEVLAEVARSIGGRATRVEPLHVRADVWESEAGGWKASLELAAAGQVMRRQVHGDSCTAVADAVALVISVAAIEDAVPAPFAAPPAAPPASPAPPSQEAPPAAAPVEIPVVAPVREVPPGLRETRPQARRRTRTVEIELGAAALVDIGSLPATAPGVEISGGVRRGWWRVEATTAYLAAQSATLVSLPTQGATLWQVDAGGRFCGAWGWARVSVGPCIGGRFAWVAATGNGATLPSTGTGNILSGLVGVTGTLHLTRWAELRLAGELAAPLDRPEFFIKSGGTVFRPSAVAFRGGFGVDAHF